MEVSDDPGGEAQVAEDDVLDALAHVGAPVRDALLGLLADQVEDHGDVVRAEAPEGVLVGAQLAEVEAVAVNVVELPELPPVEQRLEAVHGGVVLQQVAHHQDPPRPLGGRDGALRVLGGGGEGLLHEAVLARVRHLHGELGVGGHGRGEHDGVELGVGEQILQLPREARPGERGRRARACLRGGVAQPAQLAAGDRGEVAREVRSPVAEAGDADADGCLSGGAHWGSST